jgi:PAT family beta-lactamase induction signal transducer AmpG
MPTPARRTVYWVTLLYLAQGLPYGVTSKIWPVWFRIHGVSLAEIGLMGLLALPWSWKPLWAPLVDRFGSRRAWIVPCLGLLATICAAFPLLPADHVAPLLIAVMLTFTIASATQDIAIDAWTVQTVTGSSLGWINGLRAAAFRVAVIAAGGFALLVADRVGWGAAWWAIAGAFAALAVGALFLPEPGRAGGDGAPRDTRTTRELVRAFFAWLLRPQMLPVALFALLFKIGDQAMSRMIEPFWIDRGMTLSEIGLVSNTLGIGLTIAGALIGGLFVTRFGLFHGLLWLGLGQGLSNFGYWSVAALALPREAIYVASAVESFTQGLGTAALLAFLTACCRKENAATEYALLSALFSFSREVAGGLSGFGAERMGYAGFFLFTAILAAPALCLLPWLRPQLDAAAPPAAKAATPA